MRTRLALAALAAAMVPAAAGAAPKPALVAAGDDEAKAGGNFAATGWVTGRLASATSFAVDADLNEFAPDLVINTLARVGLRFDSQKDWAPVRLLVEYEHDLFTGPVYGGGPDQGPPSLYAPDSLGYEEQAIRKAFARLSVGPYVTFGGGFTTSHWGLGLLANDGNHRFDPKKPNFVDPRGGDVVARAMLATGPLTDAALIVFAAYDDVWSDDVLFPGDEAFQAVGGVALGAGLPWGAGVYGVYREQTAADGDLTKVGVIDVHGRYKHEIDKTMSFEVEAEGAIIFGTTTLAPTVEFPEHDVLQLAGTLRASFDAGIAGAIMDVTYASGDRNLDDAAQNAFKADINFEQGLLLYRTVLAAQTARYPVTASNPDLIGVPAEDLDRLPTRGNLTNTVALFPRGWVRPVDGLTIYGGPLIAFGEVDQVDPLRTRLAGGAPRNAFDQSAGTYLGTEVDLGARFRMLVHGVELEVGAEGGVLVPGDAFETASGDPLDPIYGGRLMLGLAL